MPDYIRMVPLEQFTTLDGNFVYHTFFCCIADEFAPTLGLSKHYEIAAGNSIRGFLVHNGVLIQGKPSVP